MCVRDLGLCSSFLFDLSSSSKIWHDLTLLRYRGREFEFCGDWKRTYLQRPGPPTSDGQAHQPYSANHYIVSSYLQQQCFYRTIELGGFELHPNPDPRVHILSPSEWQDLTTAQFVQCYTSQSLPVALKQLCQSWPVNESDPACFANRSKLSA